MFLLEPSKVNCPALMASLQPKIRVVSGWNAIRTGNTTSTWSTSAISTNSSKDFWSNSRRSWTWSFDERFWYFFRS